MNVRRSFQKLATDTRNERLLPVSCSLDISNLGNWLIKKLGIKDPRELEYVIERVVLENKDDDEVIEYLKALGESLVSDSEDKRKVLRIFIKKVQEAGTLPDCESYK